MHSHWLDPLCSGRGYEEERFDSRTRARLWASNAIAKFLVLRNLLSPEQKYWLMIET